MIDALLYRSERYYRIEIAWNLFAEASVTLEWGLIGGTPNQRVSCHTDLRAASKAADCYRIRALKRGYAIAS